MDAALLGHAYAKSAVDIACWDVLGRTPGVPVCDAPRRPPPGVVPALPGRAARAGRGDGRVRRGAARRGHPPLPAEARRRAARRRRAGARGARGDGRRGRRDRRRQRRLAAAGRGRRRAAAGRARPRVLRAAVPDARGVPRRAAAHDAADGARRGRSSTSGVPARIARGAAWRRSTSRSRKVGGLTTGAADPRARGGARRCG